MCSRAETENGASSYGAASNKDKSYVKCRKTVEICWRASAIVGDWSII